MVYPFGRWYGVENKTGDWCRWCKLFYYGNKRLSDIDVLDYEQAGLSCAIRTAQPHQHVARQIFLETGTFGIYQWQT